MWLLIAVLSYFLLAIVALFDRYFLIGPVQNPKVYAFYVGAVGILACLVLLPFTADFWPVDIIFLGIAAGLVRLAAIYFLSIGITKSEISRVVPANGAFLPIFSFILFFIYFPEARALGALQILAFVLLIAGSVIIAAKRSLSGIFSIKIFKYILPASFLFALSFFLSKKIYLETDFINGLFLILAGGVIGAAFLFAFPEVRKEVFSKKNGQKTSFLFLSGQAIGGAGVFLQQYAIFLADPVKVPFINSLEGLRYAFLLFFVFIISVKNPDLLKEETKGISFINKIIAIVLIGGGLAILALKI